MKRDALALGLVVVAGTVLQLVITYVLRMRGSLPFNVKVLPNVSLD